MEDLTDMQSRSRADWGRQKVEGDCSICTESLTDDADLTWCEAQCGQNYHQGCIKTWLGTDEHTKTCPYWYVIVIKTWARLLTVFAVVLIGFNE